MIKSFYNALPGPIPVRILLILVLLVILLIALNFIYTWMGDSFLDTGGGVG